MSSTPSNETMLDDKVIEDIFIDDGWHFGGKANMYIPVARTIEHEVRKQDDALIRQLLDALESAQKHHSTTSLPLAIANYGSHASAGHAGRKVWNEDVPAAITAARARLGK